MIAIPGLRDERILRRRGVEGDVGFSAKDDTKEV